MNRMEMHRERAKKGATLRKHAVFSAGDRFNFIKDIKVLGTVVMMNGERGTLPFRSTCALTAPLECGPGVGGFLLQINKYLEQGGYS
jgi:hypothetical protein